MICYMMAKTKFPDVLCYSQTHNGYDTNENKYKYGKKNVQLTKSGIPFPLSLAFPLKQFNKCNITEWYKI